MFAMTFHNVWIRRGCLMIPPGRSPIGLILRVRGCSDRTCGGSYRWARRASSIPFSPSRVSDYAHRFPPGIYAPLYRSIPIDPRLLDGSQNQVIADLKTVTSRENDIPVRPDFGKTGCEVVVRTNHFPMNIPKGPFYQYEVVTTPAVSSETMRWRIFELAEGTQSWKELLAGLVVHDREGKLVSSTMLPQPLSIDVPFYNEGEDPPAEGSQDRQTYNLAINFDRELETESLKKFIAGDPQYRSYDITPIISVLNLILAAWPSRSNGGGVVAGRNGFFKPNDSLHLPLGAGLEAHQCFYSSVRTAHNALMVNVDVSTIAFYKPSNLGVALKSHTRVLSLLPAFFKGIHIKTTHLGRREMIHGITEHTAKTYSFNHAEFGDVSVEEYMFKKYQIQLQYPDLPLVDLGGPNVNYLPAELCDILPNQPYHGKLLHRQTEVMNHYARRPDIVERDIETGLHELGFLLNVPILKTFGISISREMATIPGRVIPLPPIHFAKELAGQSFNSGTANWDLKNTKFMKGGTLRDWSILLIRDGDRMEFGGPSDPKLHKTLERFIDVCEYHGLNIELPPAITELHLPPPDKADPGRGKAISMIRNELPDMFKRKPQLVLTVLSNTDTHIYREMKRIFDVTLDIPNIPVVAQVFRFAGFKYHSNVVQKLNLKLGGINHVLDEGNVSWLGEAPTMVVGIHVTHPDVSSPKETPSVAAVVASVDRDCVHFPASLRMQESKNEMVTNLKDMMVERLKAFQSKRNEYPERILIYRDGISEGQHETVIKQEIPAIIRACKKIDPKYRPKITIVTCVKNHHTRFFPASEAANGKSYPFPGTVVDQGVTLASRFDFFLKAKGSQHDLDRSAYYFVVHDEIGFSSDQLQILTNNMSYMFAPANKAGGIVSPAYYAELACERGMCYLHEMPWKNRDGLVSGGKVWEDAVECWGGGPTGEAMKDIMFYL